MMGRKSALLLALLLAATGVGCGSQEAPINRVDVNVVDKSIFQGTWYMSRVVIDVDYEAAGFGTYHGDSASDYVGGLTAMPRIRWVVDENYIYAYRDYELVLGGDGPEHDQDILGEPVAAFKIEGHFDIKREYNAVNGEQRNVLVENSEDRRWYERSFMRIDWSKNLVPSAFLLTQDLYEVFGLYKREPADLYIQAESNFPDSWRPQFHYMQCSGVGDTNCPLEDQEHAGDYAKGELYSMSFVTQELLSPGTVADPFTGQPANFCLTAYGDAPPCRAVAIYVRTSFLKKSAQRQYEALNWADTRFDRHGYFRVEGQTYDRSTAIDDPAFGYTDALNYAVNRHNIWRNWHNADGTPIPYANRDVRRIVWHTTPELPAHLVKPAFDLVSQWNEAMMDTVRRLQGKPAAVYPRIDCQEADPNGYCACVHDPDTGEILNPTCPGAYDPFESTADAAARGVENPYDCHIVVPAGAEPDMTDAAIAANLRDRDFNLWFPGKNRTAAPGAHFEGSECVNILSLNSCNRRSIEENSGTVDGMTCQERGDARFKFLSYVDQPGTDFLGIATMRGDPITGEIIAGDANIGGPALDGYRTSALQTYDLVKGNISEQQFFTGEDVRAYLESLNNIDMPEPPRIDFNRALRTGPAGGFDPATRQAMENVMQRFGERAERLRGSEGRSQVFSDRIAALRGTDIERRLVDNPDALAMAGLNVMPQGRGLNDVTENILSRVSPFRNNVYDVMARQEAFDQKAGRLGYHGPNEYVDNSVMHFAMTHADWPRARLEIEVNRLAYRETQQHEMGHCLGLRHDFGGTADTQNYYDDYYRIADRFPLPNPDTFDRDGNNRLDATEQDAYQRAYTTARGKRELAGIDGWTNSSIMDYTAVWYERQQHIGRYDYAAIRFGYGDIVDINNNMATETPTGTARTPLQPDAITPVNTPRVSVKYYMGGEFCSTDSDCPFSTDGARSSELLEGNTTTGLTQHCEANPHGATLQHVCSNFDADSRARASGRTPAFPPVYYRFCTDERATGGSSQVGTLGWCNRFDEGASYRDIVRNIQESYDRAYIFLNFRRYRPNFVSRYFDGLLARRFVLLQNIYQNLIFEYTSNPAFRTQEGAFGFDDAFFAAVDVFNFYARVLGQPDVGGYNYNTRWQRYERGQRDPAAPGVQLGIPIGLGKYANTVYQPGISGIFRLERLGTFYDKLYTIQLMTQRGSVTSYTRDVPFYTNYYDLFPNEVMQVFGGMITDQPQQYMPRVRCDGTSFPNCPNPRLVYMDFYRGDCTDESSPLCRPDPVDTTYSGLNVVDGGSGLNLQSYAMIYGLAEFPVFFDTSFQNEMFICVEGQGDCQRPNPGDRAYTSGAPDTDVDYIRFTSPRYSKSFLGWRVEPRAGVAESSSIGYEMLKEARNADRVLTLLEKLRDGTPAYALSNLTTAERDELRALDYNIPATASDINLEIERLYGRARDLESFFNYVIEVQRRMGVAGYLRY